MKENEIFIRKGSMTTLANKKDLKNMFKENKSSKLVVNSNEIKIDYEITSKNSSKTRYGIIET